ncbi:BPSL0067 family protein [Massilia sp. RP-1-19]|uniref:BPSL0067 family protein n=1 Tax=Massilia polaris TaxID=2728846 RepID=A0A848HID0_9BURK|nr:BPSL0067 family protein [Massilia polaris]NML61626.1 BPSL0067 family protein [Massilia polaris]
MPYIYPHARLLNGKEKVGDKQCVALVRHFTKAPPSSTWRAGETVIGNTSIVSGTGIATFEDGRYPNKKTGNHTALYLYQVSDGIYVVDQWPGDTVQKPNISQRYIPGLGKDESGKFINPSNNADAFSVIK